ncbi:UNVERIFIED_ORG: sulfite reductase (NADPH) hemoprotein beta-component [Rhizobium sp. SORGH_AS260]|jgi:sulfite reductase (NADPH) hemoprotein beta-component|uniref:Sulfite reductase (NADPH) hemoprotein beta-component n=1 Tax=Bradyrhizobium lupini HPC(L) TaxID=1229491 RepID=A0ABP2RVV9_RHILU|nr:MULTISPECIES: nitrite/sulfite reductase [Agrobacterium]EKJ97130.1 sulfite reductase (NADPH) hemoprotein beta-component [Bradyrhizobium lupini HPC(L)]MBM7327023.1 nitrite/sulfite reductase [Agrobacterium sp. S2]MDP9733222.1 sulfite reductase (NADPH) hemoprotein beta-component [Rhizobium sp. SORGH_AS_0285]MDP9754949.1 sulfite reductase (NADPH) hemoprotein beta-component [Rhizobium sp. SORGH_AS_0260]MCJ2873015.1 nitrite/sulfite reductase [Agrobacterium pusense]
MYRYDEFDHAFVEGRVAQFRDQVERRLSGELAEDAFKPLRLMNGVYLQLHAYMLRVAIPYGTLNSKQMRMLAHIARKYDRGYGHFTTRQNIQYNWPRLSDTPDILSELASVEMHALQTSGNCIRNVTADHFAGAAADEVADPRPYAEILRQWSSVHPEFSFLPRKFKIAVTGAERDRAAIQVHDIGLHLKKNDKGEIGFAVYVGGGQGRTPMIAKKIRDFLPEEDLLSYTTAVMRVYNLHGRRDNKYKARIKILVHETGAEELARQVEVEFAELKNSELKLPDADIAAITAYFAPPALKDRPEGWESLARWKRADEGFARFVEQNVAPHKHPDYGMVTISLKPIGGIPGDATDEQMELVADIAAEYAFDEIRISHEQNIILPHVALADLEPVYRALAGAGLATANAGLITDIIACPGLDYCALANARSIPVAQEISTRFGSPERQAEIGELKIKISGCINACGHHHVGHIGLLGVEKKGAELYQITLGGSGDENTSIGEIIGRGFEPEKVTDAVETIVDTYLGLRLSKEENFLEAYRRVGPQPFKDALYGSAAEAA